MEKSKRKLNSKKKQELTLEQEISLNLDSEIKIYKNLQTDSKQNFWNILWLLFRKYFTSISTIYILMICLIMLVTLCLIFPPFFSLTPTLSFNFLIDGFLVYGIYFYNIRNSTFYSNFSFNKRYRLYIYSSIFLLMLFSNTLVMLFSIFFTLLMYWLNIIWAVFPFPVGIPRFHGQQFISVDYSFQTIGWGVVFYCLLLITAITFVLSFAIQINSKNIKGFFVISSGIILLNLVFGGCLFFAFGPTIEGTKIDYSVYNNRGNLENQYISFFINGNSDYIKISGEGTQSDPYVITIPPTQTYIHDNNYISPDENTIINYKYYEVTNFGDIDTRSFLWILSQIFPFYHINQMLFTAFFRSMNIIPYDPSYVPPVNTSDFPEYTNILLFTIKDGTVVPLNTDGVYTNISFTPFRATNAGWWLVLTLPYANIIFYWFIGFYFDISKRKGKI